MQELLKRQEELRESINSSREAQKEIKYEHEVSNLREMIEKQKVLLEYHSSELRSCNLQMRSCRIELKEERLGKEKSEEMIRDFEHRKAMTEKMVRSVTSKIMKLRRRRGRGNALKGKL